MVIISCMLLTAYLIADPHRPEVTAIHSKETYRVASITVHQKLVIPLTPSKPYGEDREPLTPTQPAGRRFKDSQFPWDAYADTFVLT